LNLETAVRIVTLATCHNRREKTLQALEDLHSQELPEDIELVHVLVDDGSNDGTSHSVSEKFPDVEIIHGDGNLYWAGGMRFGWEQSVKYKNFDYLFAYNDDVEFFSDSLRRLLHVGRAFEINNDAVPYVVVGSCQSHIDHSTTYGGQIRNSRVNPLSFKRADPPSDGYLLVDTLNMNCVLINHTALEATNFLAPYFTHGGADIEFGLRLRKKGGAVVLASGYYGFCERNPIRSDSDYTLRVYLKDRFNVKEAPPSEIMAFCRSHAGWFWPYSFIRYYITKLSVKLLLAGKL
jgi:GT2 family glycosyltransferase